MYLKKDNIYWLAYAWGISIDIFGVEGHLLLGIAFKTSEYILKNQLDIKTSFQTLNWMPYNFDANFRVFELTTFVNIACNAKSSFFKNSKVSYTM